MISRILLVLAVTCLALTIAQSNWNQEARDHILKYHNDMRRQENACNMMHMKYDSGLEAQAKTWAEGCQFKHEYVTGRGENLGYTTQKAGETTLIDEIANLWHNEKVNYSLPDNKCSHVCGHYTQLVWAKSTNLGCYSTQCSFGYYLVCFYTPQGNMNKRPPFSKDCAADQKCLTDQVLDRGLCYEAKDCPDKKKWCTYWEKKGYCTYPIYRVYMEKTCQKTCKTCDNENDD